MISTTFHDRSVLLSIVGCCYTSCLMYSLMRFTGLTTFHQKVVNCDSRPGPKISDNQNVRTCICRVKWRYQATPSFLTSFPWLQCPCTCLLFLLFFWNFLFNFFHCLFLFHLSLQYNSSLCSVLKTFFLFIPQSLNKFTW